MCSDVHGGAANCFATPFLQCRTATAYMPYRSLLQEFGTGVCYRSLLQEFVTGAYNAALMHAKQACHQVRVLLLQKPST